MASIINYPDLGIKLAHVADAKTNYTDDASANDLDDDAKRVAAMNATNTAINTILHYLENIGVIATS